MKKGMILPMTLVMILAMLLGSAQAQARESEILRITAQDGYPLEGKLDMPEGEVSRVVVFVNGSGPNTYDNKRALGEGTFNYFDLFSQQLTQKGVAFFRAGTRGCTPGEEPPLYTHVDEMAYQTYVPENSIRDVEEVVKALKADARLKDAQVYLLGWSEGTMIAAHVAARANVPIDHLMLCGYANGRMMDMLTWQQTGGSAMVTYGQYFDADGDGRLSRAEYAADPYQVAKALGGEAFEQLDVDSDGVITSADFGRMQASGWAELKGAIERKDDAWLKENYPVRLTSAWFEGHAALAPCSEVLPELTLPIDIFHGCRDANCDVQGVYDIEKQFSALGKRNLTTHVYPEADHDLNYITYVLTGKVPEPLAELFAAMTGQG
ncbi:MAG: alpha/beta fold hydrolase [Clostridia bacterium]